MVMLSLLIFSLRPGLTMPHHQKCLKLKLVICPCLTNMQYINFVVL
ncbi:hypothetical protein KP509_38G014300 [Ceratopteris richardii]|uniref:Uncharacterized protein n=1 Tax=Ceratopteris richardii TaxID=49495 RepID=A0A8T2Q2K4_CERRI|nr:hypothetical protein KP509_38G014300 [Ceratopteris richardii]